MFVLLTVEALYYGGELLTFATHGEAYHAASKLSGWWDIEQVL